MKNKKILFAITVFVVASVFFSLLKQTKAEELDPSAVAERRKQLEAELQDLEAQISSYTTVIEDKRKQSTSLERDVAILDAQIKKSKLEIKARTLSIKKLESGIVDKKETIVELDSRTKSERDSLGELLRQTNESDATSLFEIILGHEKMSDFLVDVDKVSSIQGSIKRSIDALQINIATTDKEKQDLEDKKTEEVQLRTIQEMEAKKITAAEKEKKDLLAVTKGQEKQYKAILDKRKKDAASIRNQLYFVTGSPAIPFEKAVEHATFAWKATGVRPALLLGLITEESNLGKNVGTGSLAVDMAGPKCTKLREAFIRITDELGLDANAMPVSKKAWYGYCGGAMGPAQFMSTTWEGYKASISKVTGNDPPNPWDPRDAFVAAALYLKNSGAKEGDKTSERTAALKYLAGSNWNKKAYAFYGDDVMDFAAKYQEQINIISGVSSVPSSNSGS